MTLRPETFGTPGGIGSMRRAHLEAGYVATTYQLQYATQHLAFDANVPGGASWKSANGGVYAPIWIPNPVTVDGFAWQNIATVAGNISVGLYSVTAAGKPGTRLANVDNTAQAGANAFQEVGITAMVVAGAYYLALAASSTSATLGMAPSSSSSDWLRMGSSCYLQASIMTMPATATPTGEASHGNGGSGTVNEHIPWIALRAA